MKIVTDDIFDKGKQAFIYFVFGKKNVSPYFALLGVGGAEAFSQDFFT